MNDTESGRGGAPAAQMVGWTSAVYGAAALVLAVGAHVAGIPPAWRRTLVFLIVAGFPVALALGWIRRAGTSAGDARDHASASRHVVAGVIGVLAVVGAAWIGLRGPTAAEAGSEPPEPPEPRIVVLPLIDLDGRGDRYFADGMTDEIAAGLASVDGLTLRGRGSAAAYVDVNRDALELGRRLGGAAVLDGTVRSGAGRVRLSLRLLDAEDGRDLWSGSGEVRREDVFALRDSVVAAVADVFGIEPGDRTLRRLERRRTTAEALDLYMLGRFRWSSGSRGDLSEAVSYYGMAIASDSGFAPAWIALADAYAALPRFTRFPAERSRVEGAAAARTALQLDPDASAAHAALGEILMLYERDWEAARAHLDRAADLDPGSAGPLALLCELDLTLARIAEARDACDRAIELDPEAFQPAWLLAGADRVSGNLPRSVERLTELAVTFPDYEPLIADLVITSLLAADSADAATRQAALSWMTLLGAGEAGDTLASTLVDLARDGAAGPRERAAVEAVIRDLGPDPAHAAALRVLAGEGDRAAAAVRMALDDRAPTALRFGVFPEYAALRDRVDVTAMLDEAGLPSD